MTRVSGALGQKLGYDSHVLPFANIKIYYSFVVCVIYHGLEFFFLEKHSLEFAIDSRVCMKIRVAEFT